MKKEILKKINELLDIRDRLDELISSKGQDFYSVRQLRYVSDEGLWGTFNDTDFDFSLCEDISNAVYNYRNRLTDQLKELGYEE